MADSKVQLERSIHVHLTQIAHYNYIRRCHYQLKYLSSTAHLPAGGGGGGGVDA